MPDPQQKAVTHGRHCVCSACAREDWTRTEIGPCGMHGKDCPNVYAPIPVSADTRTRERVHAREWVEAMVQVEPIRSKLLAVFAALEESEAALVGEREARQAAQEAAASYRRANNMAQEDALNAEARLVGVERVARQLLRADIEADEARAAVLAMGNKVWEPDVDDAGKLSLYAVAKDRHVATVEARAAAIREACEALAVEEPAPGASLPLSAEREGALSAQDNPPATDDGSRKADLTDRQPGA